MKMRKLLLALAVCLGVLFMFTLTTHKIQTVKAGGNGPCDCTDLKAKVDICHADGRAEDLKFQTLTIPCHAALKHIGEQGTPLAGHESDECGPCVQ